MTVLLFVVIGLSLVVPFFSLLNYISQKRNKLTAEQVAGFIERHLDGTEGRNDWDDFTSVGIADPLLDGVRARCCELDYASKEDRERELRELIGGLRSGKIST